MIIIIINHNLWKRIFEWPLRLLSNLVELFQVPPTLSTGCFPQCDTLYSQIQAVAQRPQSTEWNEAYNKLRLSSGLFFPVYNLWAKYKSFFIVHKKLRKTIWQTSSHPDQRNLATKAYSYVQKE